MTTSTIERRGEEQAFNYERMGTALSVDGTGQESSVDFL